MTIMQDIDLITLCQSAAGREAVALFFMLIAEAKAQRNGGRFAAKYEVIAALVHWPVRDFRRAVKTLANIDRPWLIRDGGALVIRSFQAWNGDSDGWGGARHGAGRPPSCNQEQIQEEIKMNIQDESRECASVSLTESIPPPPRTLYAVSGDVPDSPPDGGGGGGGSAAPEPQGASPPAPPEAAAPATVEVQAARERACYDALIAAGIADPGTRVRLAALPHVTAAVVRSAAREAKASGKGPGVVVSMIETASARMDLEAAARAAPHSPGVNDPGQQPSTVADRTAAELSARRCEASAARCEWAETLGVLQRASPAAVEEAKAAVLEANPTLRRTLEREDPMRNRMLGTLVAERLSDNPGVSDPGRPVSREAVVV